MGYLELTLYKAVAGIFQPILVILIRKVLPKEGTPAFPPKQTPL
jgi:hypothetical protein